MSSSNVDGRKFKMTDILPGFPQKKPQTRKPIPKTNKYAKYLEDEYTSDDEYNKRYQLSQSEINESSQSIYEGGDGRSNRDKSNKNGGDKKNKEAGDQVKGMFH
jgi:hypothetical protein